MSLSRGNCTTQTDAEKAEEIIEGYEEEFGSPTFLAIQAMNERLDKILDYLALMTDTDCPPKRETYNDTDYIS